MDPRRVIDLVVAFEKDLAAFYADLPLRSSSKAMEKICRFMAQHSEIHAQMIANYRDNADLPRLELKPLTTLHERLKTNLRQELANSVDMEVAARKLAQAEEIIGRAYAKIAAHFDEVADTYRMMANKFKTLADDERQHHDYIHREIERQRPIDGAEPPDTEN